MKEKFSSCSGTLFTEGDVNSEVFVIAAETFPENIRLRGEVVRLSWPCSVLGTVAASAGPHRAAYASQILECIF